ncbi:MAG: UDP-N-acetylglucosamine--N-acetylmuramyl-(pentapeptide) pyrophosphoryl-undecaprenol N-acetylglucosamine transferase [Bdellovibrionaceae bacterium]|nr:UDP-N-acetylglucosamine--N-acetylmuramyl-(pentapeptide) pyrophosphoryl-undecaprenol N-acetylglucosamine transferase [Pseudobdellovibrionaceae bacterium]
MKLDLEIKTENLKNMNKKKIILIAMGDSGGHIYPAFAIAERLEDRFIKQNSKNSLLEIHFVHTGSNLSSKLLSSSSYFVHKISIGGLAVGQSFLIKIKTLLQLPMAFFKAIFLIRKIKPAVIFGTGGSVTFPVLIAGFFMRKKIAIWEANTCLGLANKMLAPFVSKIFTVFPKVKSLSPKKQIGSSYPLRKQIKQANNSKLFSKDKFKILVLGGSQGSLFLNKAVHQALQDTKWREEIFIYHQTGDKSFDELDKKYKSLHGSNRR